MKQIFSFNDMINTMMPLPINGNANGDGIYCRGEELVASMSQGRQDVQSESTKEQGLDLKGVLCQYCFD